jgi:hypothetical protein
VNSLKDSKGAMFLGRYTGFSALLAVRGGGDQIPEIRLQSRMPKHHQSRSTGPDPWAFSPAPAPGQSPGAGPEISPGGLGSVGVQDLFGGAPQSAKTWMPGSAPGRPAKGHPPGGGQGDTFGLPSSEYRIRKVAAKSNPDNGDARWRQEPRRLISDLIKQAEQEGCATLRTKHRVPTIDPVLGQTPQRMRVVCCRFAADAAKSTIVYSVKGCELAGLSGGRRQLANPPPS